MPSSTYPCWFWLWEEPSSEPEQLSVNFSDTIWYYLTLSDTIWQYLILSDTIWYYLTLSDTVWPYLILPDTIWYYLTLSDTIWHYLILSDTIWYYLTLSDTIWYYLILSDPIWYYQTLSETIWYYMSVTKLLLQLFGVLLNYLISLTRCRGAFASKKKVNHHRRRAHAKSVSSQGLYNCSIRHPNACRGMEMGLFSSRTCKNSRKV